MSQLTVEVCEISEVKRHPGADRLDVAEIKGWQVVVGRDQYKSGDRVVYVPPDSIMPTSLAIRLGVDKYLSNGRVRCAKLRGEPSFGVVMPLDNPEWTVGTDVAEHYGITKWIPPLRTNTGQAAPEDPDFPKYTSIENLRDKPNVLIPGEQVVVTEKLHGTNCRLGIVKRDGVGILMAGSRQLRRQRPDDDNFAANLYWYPASLPNVMNLLSAMYAESQHSVILYGEVYGKVQSLRYGVEQGIAFRAFDLMVDGKYLSPSEFQQHCQRFDVQMVPCLYSGPYSIEKIKELSDGPSTIPGANHYREGVVVQTVTPRHDKRVGRVIMKYVGDTYLLGDSTDTAEV